MNAPKKELIMTRKNDRRGVRGGVNEQETFLYNIERQLKKKENKTDVWREKMRKHTLIQEKEREYSLYKMYDKTHCKNAIE